MIKPATLMLMIFCLCLGSSARADDAEDRSVAFTEKVNGKVHRDASQPWNPVTWVAINNRGGDLRMKDVDLKHLAGFKKLEGINIRSLLMTDAGFKELATLDNLKYLNMWYTSVKDEHVKVLSTNKKLITLFMPQSELTDIGVKELAKMTNLTTLWLSGDKVTDSSVKELQKLKNLKELDLGYSTITYVGVNELQKALPKCSVTRAPNMTITVGLTGDPKK